MTRHTRQTRRAERGTATAEYAVGTIGACSIALVLHEIATDGWWYDHLVEIIRRALAERPRLGFPRGIHPWPSRWAPW